MLLATREQRLLAASSMSAWCAALRDATEAFATVLDTYTLADLIKPQKALSLLLNRHVSLRPS
jgi:DNA-binding IscR family transcriptional regulator